MRIVSVCLSFILFALSFSLPVVAQSSNEIENVTGGQIDNAIAQTVPIRFLPNHSLYFLISIKESVTRFFKPSSASRSEFDFILSGKRLKETYYLVEGGDLDKAKINLARYNDRLDEMVAQIEKARAQNQDIASHIGFISNGFESHEIFLLYFLQKENEFSNTADDSLRSFASAVNVVDSINPGVKDRFRILRSDVNTDEGGTKLFPSEAFDNLRESTPSYNPRRIIY